jgi:hypothetical protein
MVVLLFLASLVAWYLQTPPLDVARKYLSEHQGIAPDDLELVGLRETSINPFVVAVVNVEFRAKGTDQSKKRVVEVTRWLYFLPWGVSGLREVKD